ncbi:DUF4241 domain-containing protein [Luteipulveratus sp. YIM 133132]|uniref:DUF4241 domain-containing protein n=1 Tax=Luteipulveratus flavus TaxID=3031728 RepID=UPI0023B1D734|nr:DUF4241 domain-containing protein [Luteipulveratus sp. YIM 133132]MDE9364043.1 DUF4241 domain-containing protein [Luteipulveratus sp. YIM 133132]
MAAWLGAAMDITDFHAMSTGTAPDDLGEKRALTVHDLGSLKVASGRLGVCDPFVSLDQPLVVPVPPGEYPVRVTVADMSDAQDGSHLREAYLSVVIAEGLARRVAPAVTEAGEAPEGEVYGIGVDAGTVGFVDADAVASGMPDVGESDWYTDVFDSDAEGSWFDAMDSEGPLPKGTANVVMPRATSGENVVLSHSGWGDGFYPVLATTDGEGRLLGVHIDLGVVGRFEDED